MGLICGGSGLALVSGGISGIVVGTVLSLLLLLLGRQKMQDLFVHADMPKALRLVVPRSHFENRLQKMTDEVKANFYTTLETEKNADISRRLISEISQQIEDCLSRMAEIVEIPL